MIGRRSRAAVRVATIGRAAARAALAMYHLARAQLHILTHTQKSERARA